MTVRELGRDFGYEKAAHAQMDAAGWPDWNSKPLVYSSGDGFRAIVGREHCGGRQEDPLRWHISLSGPDRIPTWEELVEVAHKLRPGVGFVVSVPPRSLWLNAHPHVLHLWETNDDALQDEWKANARGDVPS